MVVLLVVVLSTLDSFCQKKKCLTEEENKIRPDLFLYWKLKGDQEQRLKGGE